MSKLFIEIETKKTGYISISGLPPEWADRIYASATDVPLLLGYVKNLLPELNKATMCKLSDCDYIVFQD